MDKDVKLAVIFCIAAIIIVVIVAGAVVTSKRVDLEKTKAVEKKKLERTQEVEDKKTKRTKERWDAVQRLPGLKKKKDKK